MPPSDAIAAEKAINKEGTGASKTICEPTSRDYLGPFYKENSPVRASVGSGYELKGVVKSSQNCAPIAKARIELWLAGPGAVPLSRSLPLRQEPFDHRGTRPFFAGLLPEGASIHIQVSADGFQTLATQHYPAKGQTEGYFDLVLRPEN
jgi:HipA-like protein